MLLFRTCFLSSAKQLSFLLYSFDKFTFSVRPTAAECAMESLKESLQ